MPPKALKVQPKATARRTQAEREAREKAEAQRKKERADAAAADVRAEEARRRLQYGLPQNDFGNSKWRGRGGMRNGRGGRGGFMGQRTFTRPHQSGGGAGSSGFGRGGRPIHSASAGPSSGANIKREPYIKRDEDGDIAMLGIKRETEDYGYISSDQDEKALGPARNIDEINLISEDEEESGEEGDKKAPQRRRRIGGYQPIRIQRKEHKERVLGMNTEASSTTSAALRKQAQEVTQDGNAASLDEALVKVAKKGKARAKDVEFLGDTRKWKGVYDDGDDEVAEASNQVRIKEEPLDDDSADLGALAGPAEPEIELAQGSGAADAGALHDDEAAAERDVPSSPETKAHVKAKLKQRKKSDNNPPAFQTAEERREWAKHQEDLVTIQQELGRINVNAETTGEDDSKEDVAAQESEQADRRQDAVYLFQLPPLMPDLRPAGVKQEPPDSPTAERSKKGGPSNSTDAKNPVKVEDEDFGGDSSSRANKPVLAAGCAGKLRVHKSGRATLTWGGANMELTMGISPYFLQTTILTRMGAEASRAPVEGGFGGEAVSFGQIRGKLVVTPDWTEILG